MLYSFAQNLTIDEVQAAIDETNRQAGAKAFIRKDTDEYVLFNYIVSMPENWVSPQEEGISPAEVRRRSILRECRGLAFDMGGRVISRPLHKFFNLGEKLETQPDVVPWDARYSALEKLDGSMIRTMDVSCERKRGSRILLGTRMGPTDISAHADAFVAARKNYQDFIQFMTEHDRTVIFEYCSRRQRIVLDYPVERLVLTAVRSNKTGEYLVYSLLQDYAEMYDIDLVKVIADIVSDRDAFLETIRGLKGAEGTVLRWNDSGHMLKVKAEEYVMIHGAKDGLTFEKDVLAMILDDGMDDVKAALPESDRKALDEFYAKVLGNIRTYAADLEKQIRFLQEGCYAGNSLSFEFVEDTNKFMRKLMAVEIKEHVSKQAQGMAFKILDGKDPLMVVRDFVRQHCGSGSKVDSVRNIFDARWQDHYLAVDMEG